MRRAAYACTDAIVIMHRCCTWSQQSMMGMPMQWHWAMPKCHMLTQAARTHAGRRHVPQQCQIPHVCWRSADLSASPHAASDRQRLQLAQHVRHCWLAASADSAPEPADAAVHAKVCYQFTKHGCLSRLRLRSASYCYGHANSAPSHALGCFT